MSLQNDTLISVVMPVYNRAHLMQRVLGSLLAQTHRNLEIVVVDDCSSDDIETAIAAFGDARVRLVRRATNGGVAAARNTGVDAAQADWIAFHDSDDICVHDRIEQSVAALAGRDDEWIGVYGARVIYNEVSEETYARADILVIPRAGEAVLSGDLAARTLRGNIINFPTLLARKSALLAAGPSDPLLRKNVDWDLCLRLTRQGKIAFVCEPLVLTPTSLDPHVSAARVSRSARQGARSFIRITGKLKRAGFCGPGLAPHYASAARYLMRIDRPRLARRFLAAALVLNPRQPRLWAHWALSHAPALHARLRRRDRL